MFVDYYAVLNLSFSCSAREVREAFKHFALLYHPDRGEEGEAECFRKIKDAYDVLSDPARRYLYDLGYADMQCARRLELETLERRVATQQQLSRRGMQRAQHIQSENVGWTSSIDNSLHSIQTPLSFSENTMSQSVTTRWEGREASDNTKEVRVEAARAVPNHVSVVGSPRVCRAAHPPCNDRISDSQDDRLQYASEVQDSSEPCEMRPAPALTWANAHPCRDGPEAGKQQQCREQKKYSREKFGGRFCSTSSLVIPKTTTLQWCVERPRSQRVFTLPTEKSRCASVVKTWKAFFDLTDEGWGQAWKN